MEITFTPVLTFGPWVYGYVTDDLGNIFYTIRLA